MLDSLSPLTHEPLIERDEAALNTAPEMRRGLLGSAAAHIVVAVALLIDSAFFPTEQKKYIPTLKVDLVALPDQLKNERSMPKLSDTIEKAIESSAPKAKAPEEAPAKDEMVLKPKKEADRKKKMLSALDRIKALDKIQPDEEIPRPALPIKGNRLSKGTSTSEDAKESDQPNYLDSIRDHLRENWSLPVWLSRQNLSAQVQIFVDGRGLITAFRFVRPSGNPQFDEAVRDTLKVSQPLPPPPTQSAGSLRADGVVLGFPL